MRRMIYFQTTRCFYPVLIMHLAKNFLKICIAAILLVENGENNIFILPEKFSFEGN